MDISAGVGISHHRSPDMAGREAAAMALQQANIEQPDFVFMFATVGYDQQPLLDGVRAATGHAPLCGCSGVGVIAATESDETNFAVAVMVIASGELRFENGLALGLHADSAAVGRQVAESIQPHIGDDAVGLFVFPDALTTNYDHFQSGLEQTLVTDHFLPILGGGAGDNWAWKQTYQYCNDQVVSDGVTWMLLSGQAKLAYAVSHGCEPLGGKRQVTRAENNVLYEIDGQPALDVFAEYLTQEEINNWSGSMVSFALGFEIPGETQGYETYTIRAAIGGKDEETGAVILPSDVPTEATLWMTRRDYRLISQGVDRIGEEITTQLGAAEPALVFQFDCGGRGNLMLRDQQKLHLLHRLQHEVGPTVPWLGFYTYFEIGPMGERNSLHNYTAVVAALYSETEHQSSALPIPRQRKIAQRTQPEEPQDELGQLRRENQRLAEEVKQLVQTEHDLQETQSLLNRQFRLYRELYETGKKFNATFDLNEILKIATRFVIYGLNFERCLIFLRGPADGGFRVAALDGYYDEAEKQAVESLVLPTDQAALPEIAAGETQLLYTASSDQPHLLALSQRLGMDEYLLLPLEGEAGHPMGLLAVGNTEKMAPYQTRVEADGEAIVGLANLISQTSTAMRNALFYQAIEESEKKYRSLFEDSNDAIFITSTDGKLIDMNPAGLRLFGIHPHAIDTFNVADLYVNPEERAQFRQEVEQHGAVTDFEVAMRKRDGSQFIALITATTRQAEDGSPDGYQGIIRDITVQKQNELLQAENMRLNTELEVTQRLQEMILPKTQELEAVEGLDIAAFMEPADEVGGDYYDVLHHNGQIKIGIGDVTGHGLESGVLMLMTQMGVRTLLTNDEDDPVNFLDVLNRTLYHNVQRMEIDKNLSLALLNYTPNTENGGGQLRMSGQHEELIVVRQCGSIELIDTMPLGFPVGLDDDIADFISEMSIELAPGDGVVLYTDGITEAENAANEQYGMERLCDAIRRHWTESAEAIKTAVIDDVRHFIGDQTVFDDITLLVLKQQ